MTDTVVKIDTLEIKSDTNSPAPAPALTGLGKQVDKLVNDNKRLRVANEELQVIIKNLRAGN